MSLLSFHARGWRGPALAFAAGALAALSMAPFHLWPVLLVSIPLLLLLLDEARAARAAVLGWCFGFGYFLASLYWIGIAFLVDAGTYGWLLPLAVTGLPAYLALYWAGGTALAVRLSSPAFRPAALAAALTLAEYARGHWLTGFPWNAPGYAAMASDAFAQAASLTGLWGLTFLVLLAASLPFCLAQRRWLASAGIALLCLGIWVAGAQRLAAPTPADAALRIRIVQPNIPQSDKWRFENAQAIFLKLIELSDKRTADAPQGAAGFRQIIWPESAVPFLMDEQEAALSAVDRLLPDDSMLLMGSLRREPAGAPGGEDDRIFNSLLAISGSGRVEARFDKFHLVPWGEYLPLESWLKPLGLRKLVTLPGSFVAGPGPRTLSLPGLPSASPLVCYEVIFPGRVTDPAARPGYLLNITNDGWFGQSTGPWQHLDQARLRAIEEGLPLLRAANTGISAVVDAKGRLRASSGLGVEAVVDSVLPAPLGLTPYARLGDFPVLFLCFTVLVTGFLRRNSRFKVNPIPNYN